MIAITTTPPVTGQAVLLAGRHKMPDIRLMGKINKKPAPPAVPLAGRRELYAAAYAFHELRPWEWMHDVFWLGVQTHGVARILCVLGRNREVFGLVAYRGAGINQLLRLRIGAVEPEDEGNMHAQDAILLDFGPKSGLHQNDKQLLKELAYSPPQVQPRGFPCFRSQRPWYLPWFLDETETQMMLHDLRCMANFARLIQQQSEFFDDRDPLAVPFLLTPFQDQLSLDVLDWRQMVVTREETLSSLPPEETLAALRQLPIQSELHLQLDAFPSSMCISEGPRPWVAKMALAVDATNGMVWKHELGTPQMTLGDTAIKCLVDLMQQRRCRPRMVSIYPEQAEALAPLANAVQLAVQVTDHLPLLEEARFSLMERFGG